MFRALKLRLYEVLESIQNAVRVNGSRGNDALRDPEINSLHKAWQEEHAS